MDVYQTILLAMASLSVVVFLVLLRISAPYGRHRRAGWGFEVSSRHGWLVMEAPAALVLPVVVLGEMFSTGLLVFVLLWECHYAYRAFWYPLTLHKSSRMPVSVVIMGMVFNCVNGSVMAIGLLRAADRYDLDYLLGPAFLTGSLVFVFGMWLTRQADAKLRSLRAAGQGYQVPFGGLYRWVSCPNYLGESLQWAGWALATLSPAAVVFLLWTLANLVPRALSHHRWYQQTFSDYPIRRKAFLPFVL